MANHFGYGPFTVFPLSHHNEPFMPGDRTCSGGAYTFQVAGALTAQDNVAIPMKIHDAASVRCVFAYVQQATADGQSAYVVKYSTDGGATWNMLEKMGIAQNLGTPFKNTYDFLVGEGYGKPETRRLPYADFGLVSVNAVTGGGSVQTVHTASYDASTTGLVAGRFIFFDLGGPTEECVETLAVDPDEPDVRCGGPPEPSGVRLAAMHLADANSRTRETSWRSISKRLRPRIRARI